MFPHSDLTSNREIRQVLNDDSTPRNGRPNKKLLQAFDDDGWNRSAALQAG
jgi:hypothetical protein